MSFRLLPALVFAIFVAVGDVRSEESAPKTWDGTVTLCEGHAKLIRGGEAFLIVRGAGLQCGDQIVTDDATVAMAFEGGPVVTAASSTIVQVDLVDDRWEVQLPSGQARVVHDGKSELTMSAGQARTHVGRAIVQFGCHAGQTAMELIAGDVRVRSRGRSVRIQDSGAFVLESNQVKPVSAIKWATETSGVRLATALQTAPVLQPPSTTQGQPVIGSQTANGGQTGNQTGSGNQGPITGRSSQGPAAAQGASPTGPGSTATPNTNAGNSGDPVDPPVLNPEDELIDDGDVPDAAPPATRGGDQDNSLRAVTNSFAGSSSLSLGSLSSGSGTFSSGGIFGDANQQTFQGQVDGDVGMFPNGSPFPGGIHLATGETRFPFDNVTLTTQEFNSLFGADTDRFYSIGTGAVPTTQVATNFFTGTSPTPEAVKIPRFDAHLVFLDQYNIPDPAQGALGSNIGLTGLIGPNPTGPVVVGTTPLADERALLNNGATFALGEFLVTANGPDGVSFTIRRSDQDRLIVKDPGGNDADDLVTPNTDVTFTDAVDPRFLPQSPTVKVPVSLDNRGTGIGSLNLLRRAAFTTLIADQLKDYSRRTGQTRFVLDGKIIDISGFRPQP